MFKRTLSFLGLFFSVGTLLCCALPALFVSLGMGATLVSMLSAFPQLIWFSEHKLLVFGIAGGLLLVSAYLKFRSNQACPLDPILAAQCGRMRKLGGIIFYFSLLCYVVGGFFAFIAPLVF